MIDFKSLLQNQAVEDSGVVPELLYFKSRDGSLLPYRFYPSNSTCAFIFIHGSAGHSQYLSVLGQSLAQSGLASVYTPDVRGHGRFPEKRGDISYLGQLEDDLEDLINQIKERNPAQKIIVGGHSSGGGFALRFSRKPQAKDVDGFILMAPYLAYDAPTTRRKGVDWATPFLTRMIGIEVLNNFGVRRFNGTPVIQFNLPQELCNGSETIQYSYRLYKNFHPENYVTDLKQLVKPLLVLAGEQDEAFFSQKYSQTILPLKKDAEVIILKNCTHMNIVINEDMLNSLGKFFLKFVKS